LHFIDNIENKPYVNHIDSNRSNCHYTNLEWTTASENNLHAFKYGFNNQNHTRKLTIEKVSRIRELYNAGQYSHRQLAKIFNVSKTTISQVLRNKVYKEVS
jgi:DNA-binding XRE family transcriptional regulator